MTMLRVLVVGALAASMACAAGVDVQSAILAADDDCDASSSQCHLGLIQAKVQTEATVQRTATTEGNSLKAGTCTVWGDGQVSVFDKARVSWPAWLMSFFRKPELETDFQATDEVDFWLVNSEDVKIQARYIMARKAGQPQLKGIAFSGNLVRDCSLTVGADGAPTYWNGVEILKEPGDTFDTNLVKAKYVNNTALVEDDSQQTPGYTFEFPEGVSMIINRQNHTLGLAITLAKPFENQDGQCGNYNGDHEDDALELIEGRMGMDLKVQEDDCLFRHAAKRGLSGGPGPRGNDDDMGDDVLGLY